MSSLSITSFRSQLLRSMTRFIEWYINSKHLNYRLFVRFVAKRVSPQRFLLGDLFSAQTNSTAFNYPLLFNQYYDEKIKLEKGYWYNIEAHAPNSIAGYVSYVKGKTKLGIYHFFSVNYGLRKPFLGHIALIKNNQFIACYKITLSPSTYIEIDLDNIFPNVEADLCYVELYHPRLPVNHGGHGGHIRYWGIYGNHSSIVHSMPIDKMLFKKGVFQSCRSSFPEIKATPGILRHFNFWGGKFKISSEVETYCEKTPFGFYSMQTATNDPQSIWHSAQYDPKPATLSNQLQIVALPPIAGIDVHLSFLESLQGEGSVTFHLYQSSKLISSAEKKLNAKDQIKISEIFSNIALENSFVIVDFSGHGKCIHSGYIHLIYFLQNKVADCVHSHQLSALNLLEKSHVSSNLVSSYKKGNCLKFMPFPVSKEFQSWLALWTGNLVIPAKLRFINQNGNEFIHNFSVLPDGIQYIDLNKIYLDLSGKETDKVVVQLESLVANIDASLFTFSTKENTLAVDHLTGG